MNYIREYWNQIQLKNILVSKRIYQQFEVLIDDLDNPKDPFIFCQELADAPIEFIENNCKHSKAPFSGKPFLLMLWQKAITQATYGFVHKNTFLRQYDEVMVEVGRKNGKTTYGAGLEHFMMIGDGEGGAEVYSIATKLDQAKIAFTEAKNMVAQSSLLQKYVKPTKYQLDFPHTFSFMKPLASDSKSLDGLNVHFALLDELHAWRVFDLYDVVKQATSSREQPLIFIITTNGHIREAVFDNKYQYGCDVLDGLIEDKRKLFFFYELDEKLEWMDESMWIKANPGLGVIKKVEKLRSFVEQAMNDEAFLPAVLTKDFNIPETSVGSWLSFDTINNTDTFNIEDFNGSYAVCGNDLSSTVDLTCATVLLMKPDEPTIYVHQMYFIPRGKLEEKIKDDKIPYDQWVARGFVQLCDGNKVNYDDVKKWYTDLVEVNNIRPLWSGYDPWNSDQWVRDMKDYGFDMEEIRQGAQTLSQPMKLLSAELADNHINYNNNPVLKWNLTNTNVQRDNNDNIRPIKKDNQKLRIDGSVSLIIAYATLLRHWNDYQSMI